MTLDTLQQNCLVASSVLSYNYYTVPYELCHVLTENWQTWHRQFLWWRRPNVSLKGVRFSQQFFWGKNYIFTIFFYGIGHFNFQTCAFLTVVEWKDYHFLAVATVSDLQNSYCNQWPHPYEPQISNKFVFSAVCLHFTAN